MINRKNQFVLMSLNHMALKVLIGRKEAKTNTSEYITSCEINENMVFPNESRNT